MIQIRCGKQQTTGKPVLVVTSQDGADAIGVMRMLKQQFPNEWQQVNRELFLPANGMPEFNPKVNHEDH